MNKKNLFWIVPLVFLLGLILGFELSFPQKITLDYGSNILTAINTMDEITKREINFTTKIDPVVVIVGENYSCLTNAEWKIARACYMQSKLIQEGAP